MHIFAFINEMMPRTRLGPWRDPSPSPNVVLQSEQQAPAGLRLGGVQADSLPVLELP